MVATGLHGRGFLYEKYSSVSHTALAMARGHRSADHGDPGGHSQTGVDGAGGRYWSSSSLSSQWWRWRRSVVPALKAQVGLVQRAVISSLRNLLTMNRQKSASLGALVLQTSLLALTIRYSRTETVSGPRYLTSTAVVMSELIKLVACLYMVAHSSKRKGWDAVWDELMDVKEAVKTAVPSGIYTLQNNLQFIAVSHLDAATFQVTYQLKILTTAVFSVLFLHRHLDSLRWSALVLLTVGVALVQLPSSEESDGGASRAVMGGSTLVGLMAVLIMSLSSGFAGVYFEKILKASTQSLWAKNAQMACFSVVLGLMAVVAGDWHRVVEHGFFQGYNITTVIVVLQQAILGLIISLVMKYADNILKGFASAISIILTSFISYIFLNDLQPSSSFLAGASIVMGSVVLYNVDRQRKQHTLQTVV